MKTKICKYCQSEISQKAKLCPNCRKKQGLGCGNVFSILFIVIVLIPFIIGKLFSSDEQNASNTANSSNTSAKSQYAVGDVVNLKDCNISFLSANAFVSDNEFIVAKEGCDYWKFEFEFENTGKSDITISSMLGWNCYADGYAASQSFIDMDNDLSGIISTGKKIKGSLIFEIPKDAKEIELEYKDNPFLDNKIVFKIK